LHYEEYSSDYYSDNRPIFIQVDIKALQSSLKPPQEPKRRRLYSKDPENVKLYIEMKFKLMQQYKIEDSLSDLEDRINALQAQQCTPDTALLHSIKQVDQHLTRISLEAETSIKKRGPHKWNLAAIQCNREYIALRYKQKLLRKSGDDTAIQTNCQEMRQKAIKLKKLIKEQSKWWVTQLHNHVSELSTSNDPGAKLKTKLKQQIHQAYEKQIYNKLKEVTGKHKKYEDPHIVVQVEGRPTVIRDPDEVAQRFRDHNITHFA
jgi:3-oxoacyl-ACP reductase-like protein